MGGLLVRMERVDGTDERGEDNGNEAEGAMLPLLFCIGRRTKFIRVRHLFETMVISLVVS